MTRVAIVRRPERNYVINRVLGQCTVASGALSIKPITVVFTLHPLSLPPRGGAAGRTEAHRESDVIAGARVNYNCSADAREDTCN